MNAMLNIQVRVLGQQAAAQIRAIQTQLNGLQTTVARNNTMAGTFNSTLGRMTGLEKFGKNLQWTGRQLEFNFTLPLILAGAAATKWALDNERSMTRVRKVYGDLGEDVSGELDAIQESFTLLSNRFGVALSEVTDIGAAWAQAGAAGAALPRVTQATLEAMIIGEMEATEATEGLIAVQSAYRLNTLQLHDALAQLNIIENQTSIQFDGLIDVITRAGGSARTAGIDLRHLAAMASVLVPAAGSASQAGNSLRTIFSRLLVPTKQAAEVLNEMGLDINSATWQAKNGVQRVEALATSFVNLSQGQQAMVSSMVASRWQINRFDTLMRDIAMSLDDATEKQSSYAKALAATSDQEKANAVYAQELSTVLASSPRAFSILTTNIKNAMAEAIVPLLPMIIKLLHGVRGMIAGFNDLSPATQNFIMSMLVLLAVVGPAQRLLGAFIQLFTTGAHIVHFFGVRILWVAGIFTKAIGGMLGIATTVFGGIASAAMTGIGFLTRALLGSIVFFGDLAFKAVTIFFGVLRAGFQVGVVGVINILRAGLVASLAGIGQAMTVALGGLSAAASTVMGAVVAVFSAGATAARVVWGAATAAISAMWAALPGIASMVSGLIVAAHAAAATGAMTVWRLFLGTVQVVWQGFAALAWVGAQAALGSSRLAIVAWTGFTQFMRTMPILMTAVWAGTTRAVSAALAAIRGIMAAQTGFFLAIGQIWHLALLNPWLALGVLVAAVFAGIVIFFRDDIVGGIIAAFNMLPQGIQSTLITVINMIKRFAQAVYEWLSYLNPFARHSPSLVDSVTRGVDTILSQYARLNGVKAVIKEAVAAHNAFLAATGAASSNLRMEEYQQKKADIVAVSPGAGPAVDNLVGAIFRLKGALVGVNYELSLQQSLVNRLEDELETAMKPYNDQLRENEFQQKRLRLEILKMEQAGQSIDAIRDKYSKLNGEIEMLTGERESLRYAGADGSILAVYDERIKALRGQANAMEGATAPIEALQNKLDELEMQGQITALERDVNLEPQIRALDIEKEKLAEIKDIYQEINSLISDMEGALNSLASAAKPEREAAATVADQFATAGLGDFEVPGGEAPPGLGREGGLADIEAFNKEMEAELERSLGDLGSFDMMQPFKDMWNSGWNWIKENVGPKVAPIWDSVKSWWNGIDWGGLGQTVKDAFSGDLFGDFSGRFGTFVDTISGYVDNLKAVWGSVWEVLKDVWGVIKEELGPVFEWLGEQIVEFGSTIWDEIKNWEPLLDDAMEAFGHLAEVVEFVFKYVILPVITIVLAAILTIWRTTWPILKAVLEPILDSLAGVVSGALETIRGIITFVLAVINGDWGRAWEGIKTIFSGIWNTMHTLLKTPIALILGLIQGMVNGAIGLINTLIGGINWVADKLGLGFEIPVIGRVNFTGSGSGGSIDPRKPHNAGDGVTVAQSGAILPAVGMGGHGGFMVNRPTAIVGEGSSFYPEYVIPTDPKWRSRAMGLYESLGTQLMAGGGWLDKAKDVIGGATKTVTGFDPFAVEVFNKLGNIANTFWGIMGRAGDQLKNLTGWGYDVAQNLLLRTMAWGKDKLGEIAKSAQAGLDAAGLGGVFDAGKFILDNIPGLAEGGIVLPKPGGTVVRLGEGGQAEMVQPLPRGYTGGGDTFNFYGDLSFPNISDPNDAERFISNLKSLAG